MNRRIVLLGFMGCGKTTVAKALAAKLVCDFVDLDSFITKREGRSPAEIIQANGEASFRQVETLALRDVLENRNARVIALGGGTWTIGANRNLIALHDCLSIWLDATFELCWKRIAMNARQVRPMAPDRETAKKNFDTRRAHYALAERQILVSKSASAKALVEEVLRQL